MGPLPDYVETEPFIVHDEQPHSTRKSPRAFIVHDDVDLYSKRLFFWAIVGTLCSSALSFLIFLSEAPRFTRETTAPRGPVLRRPNPYMNLEKVLQTSNRTFPPITNLPRLVFQLNPADPQRTMTEDDRGWISSIGAVYPDDRHIVVSPKNSTILHFRHLDFAMEDCQLIFVPPQRTNSFDPSTKLEIPSQVDVWILDSSSEISRYTRHTWSFAPQRVRKLTTLDISEHTRSSSGHFYCPTNQFTTLELACSPLTPSCDVDFWQDLRAVPLGGLFMTQRFTGVDGFNEHRLKP